MIIVIIYIIFINIWFGIMKHIHLTTFALGLLSIASLAINPAHADVDPFEFQVYGYDTQGKGNFDPELLNSYVAAEGKSGGASGQGILRSAIELEYGLSKKIDFAYYLNLARPDDQTVQYAGSKFRFRGQLWEKDQLPLNFGWYSEIEWWDSHFNNDQLEAEFMVTMQKDIGKWTFIINAPDVDKVFVGVNRKEVLEIGWRGETSYQLTETTRFGIQVYGSAGKANDVTPVGQQQHYVVPTVHTLLFNSLRSSLGLGFGLTEGSDLFFLKANFHFGGDRNERIYD